MIIYLLFACLGSLGFCYLTINHLKKQFKTPDLIHNHGNKSEKIKNYHIYYSNWISLIHATIMILYSARSFFEWDENRKNSLTDKLILSFSFGYYLFDTIYALIYNTLSNTLLSHHALMFVLIIYSIYIEYYGFFLFTMYFFGEITLPLYVLYVNLEFHSSTKKISSILGAVFSLSFILLRGGYLNYLCFSTYSYENAPLVLKLFLGFGLYISLKLSFFILNKFLKGLKDIFRNEIAGYAYNSLCWLRKLKYFDIVFEVFLIMYCFGSLIFFKHNRMI